MIWVSEDEVWVPTEVDQGSAMVDVFCLETLQDLSAWTVNKVTA